MREPVLHMLRFPCTLLGVFEGGDAGGAAASPLVPEVSAALEVRLPCARCHAGALLHAASCIPCSSCCFHVTSPHARQLPAIVQLGIGLWVGSLAARKCTDGMLATQACAAGRSRAQTLLDIILDAVWLLQRSRLLTPGFVQCIHSYLLQARAACLPPRP